MCHLIEKAEQLHQSENRLPVAAVRISEYLRSNELTALFPYKLTINTAGTFTPQTQIVFRFTEKFKNVKSRERSEKCLCEIDFESMPHPSGYLT